MSLRIIAGRLGGRRFDGPTAEARPTTDRVREALFSMLEARMEVREANVLDLFSGTGALSFEALSRGAADATLVEWNARMLATARENAARLGLASACHFVKADAYKWLETAGAGQGFDLVVADPPYHDAGATRLPDLARALLSASGWFVLEHKADLSFEDRATHVLTRIYGGTALSLFRNGQNQ